MRDAVGNVQSILVLGGTSDLGLAIAQTMAAARGATVVLAGRDQGRLDAAAQQLRDAGTVAVETAVFDADDVDSHGRFCDEVFADRDFDVVVLAVGVLGDQETSERDHRHAAGVLHTNFVGCASVALCVAGHLRRQGHGTLVVLSSIAGERVRRANFVYGASKAGLDGFAQGLGDSLQGTGARVMIVRPGFVHTSMTAGRPVPPFSTTAEVVAGAVDAAFRKQAEVVWVPGILRLVMSVLRHLPRAVFRRLPL
ncbi:MAG TPA: decaprenylphospho-beta-D-erythro-pentofuranosid-2-ulose 2-reductase [Egibacteraceae bacterium]|nr:decaprenylphospho-beta-D-erythro-pentofuranosid-2-ulose 2-reductase [Egibacteraceae bacterium]